MTMITENSSSVNKFKFVTLWNLCCLCVFREHNRISTFSVVNIHLHMVSFSFHRAFLTLIYFVIFNRTCESYYQLPSSPGDLITCKAIGANSISINNDDYHYSLPSCNFLHEALLLHGPVSKGYGRGSKKLGFPTANLPHFDSQLASNSGGNLPNGVYFGWGRVADGSTVGCVANIGKSPTFVGQENSINIVEAHLLAPTSLATNTNTNANHGDSSIVADFYDEPLSLCLVMFLRPERKFPSFDTLISQINKDVAWSKELQRLAEEGESVLDAASCEANEEKAALIHLQRCRNIADVFLTSKRRQKCLNLIFERERIM